MHLELVNIAKLLTHLSVYVCSNKLNKSSRKKEKKKKKRSNEIISWPKRLSMCILHCISWDDGGYLLIIIFITNLPDLFFEREREKDSCFVKSSQGNTNNPKIWPLIDHSIFFSVNWPPWTLTFIILSLSLYFNSANTFFLFFSLSYERSYKNVSFIMFCSGVIFANYL